MMIPSLMPVLVVARLSPIAAAHFYIAWLLSSVLLTVSAAVAGNLLAELSYDDEPMAQKLRKASRLIAGLLLPPSIFLAVFGRWVLGIFGPTYAANSYGILLLFVVVAVPDAVTNVYVTLLRVKGEPHKAAAMNLVMAAVALGGAWFLMGSIGVAVPPGHGHSRRPSAAAMSPSMLWRGRRNRPPVSIGADGRKTEGRPSSNIQ